MITLSKLTEKDLEIFKGKKVFLCSAKPDPHLLYQTFNFLNINVVGYSILDKAYHPTAKGLLTKKIIGLNYIKASNLDAFFRKENAQDFIVQPVGAIKEHFEQVNLFLSQRNVEKSNVSSGEIVAAFHFLFAISQFKSNVHFVFGKIKNSFRSASKITPIAKSAWEQFCEDSHENTTLICSPPKTADYTLNYTFDLLVKSTGVPNDLSSTFQYVNLWHCPNCINRAQIKKISKKLKIVVGLREPISQNLSVVFHNLGRDANLTDLFYSELFESYPRPSRKALVGKYTTLFQYGIDVQAFWDMYIDFYTNKNYEQTVSYRRDLIQNFMPRFKDHVLDITAYPFNKEKGYTIIKNANTEVFVYQLEKLNSLVPELSDWVGVPFDKLENGNQASDKWIAESYKQAQKEIEITQEYFDKCFDEPYVKHCYSEVDIEKFKARWRPHIKKDA